MRNGTGHESEAVGGNGSAGATATEALLARGAAVLPGEAVLRFAGLRLHVHIGCTAEERARPQDVDLDVSVRFAALPAGCRTDRLEDTVCYAEMSALAGEVSAARAFHLIERLALDIHDALRARLPEGARLGLRVTKVAPPVPGLRAGVSFSLGEL